MVGTHSRGGAAGVPSAGTAPLRSARSGSLPNSINNSPCFASSIINAHHAASCGGQGPPHSPWHRRDGIGLCSRHRCPQCHRPFLPRICLCGGLALLLARLGAPCSRSPSQSHPSAFKRQRMSLGDSKESATSPPSLCWVHPALPGSPAILFSALVCRVTVIKTFTVISTSHRFYLDGRYIYIYLISINNAFS